MSNNIKLAKDIILSSIAIASKNNTIISDASISLKSIVNNLSSVIPICLNEDFNVDNKQFFNLSVEKIDTDKFYTSVLIKKIIKLYDGTFLAVLSNGKIIQYDANFSNVQAFPFEYQTITDDSDYFDVSDVCISDYSISNPSIERGNLVFLACKTNEVVQMYKYYNKNFTHVKTLGTLNTANHSASHFDEPIALTASNKMTSESNVVTLFVSNGGSAPNSEVSFLKRLNLDFNGIVNTEVILSFPKAKIQEVSANNGSLLNNELSLITKMQVGNDYKTLLVISEDKKEFGGVLLNPDLTDISTVIFTKNNLKQLEYNDVFSNPISFHLDSSGTAVVGDEYGHIGLMNNRDFNLSISIGKPKPALATTTYPLEFKAIDDVLVNLYGDILFVSDGEIYRTNLDRVAEQEIKYSIPAIGIEYSIKDIHGVMEFIDVSFSIDDEIYYPLIDWKYRVVSSNEPLFIKLKIKEDDIVKNVIPNINPLLLIEI